MATKYQLRSNEGPVEGVFAWDDLVRGLQRGNISSDVEFREWSGNSVEFDAREDGESEEDYVGQETQETIEGWSPLPTSLLGDAAASEFLSQDWKQSSIPALLSVAAWVVAAVTVFSLVVLGADSLGLLVGVTGIFAMVTMLALAYVVRAQEDQRFLLHQIVLRLPSEVGNGLYGEVGKFEVDLVEQGLSADENFEQGRSE